MPGRAHAARSWSKPSSHARRPPSRRTMTQRDAVEVRVDVERPRLCGAHRWEAVGQRLDGDAQGQELGVGVGDEPDHDAVPEQRGAARGGQLDGVVEAAVVAAATRRRSGTRGSSWCVSTTSRRRRARRGRVAAETPQAIIGGPFERHRPFAYGGVAERSARLHGPEDRRQGGGDVAPQEPLPDLRRDPHGGDERREVIVQHRGREGRGIGGHTPRLEHGDLAGPVALDADRRRRRGHRGHGQVHGVGGDGDARQPERVALHEQRCRDLRVGGAAARRRWTRSRRPGGRARR